VRSTVAHGRIKSINIDEASKVPGVYRIVTSEDIVKIIPHPYYGPAFHDQPILAIGKVHYVGEPVAAVLASDPHVAEEAARLIVVDYEELPAVFDEVEAQKSRSSCMSSSSRPAPSQTSSICTVCATPMSRSTSSSSAAMPTRPSPRPIMSSSTRSAPAGAARAA